jgi:SNF2 family DNA or RNA helicase
MRILNKETKKLLEPVDIQPWDRLMLSLHSDDFKILQAKIYSADPTKLPSNPARLEWIKRIQERKRIDRNQIINYTEYFRPTHTYYEAWLLKATDVTVAIIDAVWPKNQVIFADSAVKSVYDHILLTMQAQEMCAEVVAKYKAFGEVPNHKFQLHPDVPLLPYQQVALYNSINLGNYALFMEQGTGKTPVVIARVCNEAKKSDKLYKVLIVCPKAVRSNWEHEFARFSTCPGKVTAIRGDKWNRVYSLVESFIVQDSDKYAVCIISYDSLKKTWEAISKIKWDLVVLDEAHYIKNITTDRAKFAMKLRDISENRMVLTGTPISNSPLDLYPLFEFLGEGWSGFYSWKNFKDFYGTFEKIPDAIGIEKLVSVKNMAFMKERLARLSFVINKAEALPQLPEKVYDIYEIELTDLQKNIYTRIAKDLIHEIEEELEKAGAGNKTIVVNNVLTKLLRLAQICAGFVVWTEQQEDFIDINLELDIAYYDNQNKNQLHQFKPKILTDKDLKRTTLEYFPENPKLEALVEILKEKNPNQKTIVWTCFTPSIKQISHRLHQEGINHVIYYGKSTDVERDEAQRRFNNDPDCKVFVGNPAAGGVGINLLGYPLHDGTSCNTNCDHVIYFSQNWSMVQRTQSEDRTHRKGTRTNVRITDLVVLSSVDEEIYKRVIEKRKTALDITDVKEILKNVLRTNVLSTL